MYKVFFNDRIVFMDTDFKKTSIKGGLFYSVSENSDMNQLWTAFVTDKDERDLYLSSNSVGKLKNHFFAIFKIIEAAGGLVFNAKEQLLCIKRLGKWDLPKGKLEKNESIEEAAIREVIEETGISSVEIEQFKETTYHIYQSPYHQNRWVLKPTYWYIMKYLGNETLVPQTKESITEAKWIDRNDLEIIKQQTYASLKGLFGSGLTQGKQ